MSNAVTPLDAVALSANNNNNNIITPHSTRTDASAGGGVVGNNKKSLSMSSLTSFFKDNREAKLKIRLVFFLVLLVAMVVAGLVSSTLIPWLLTRYAGLNAVSSTVESLVSEQADHLRDKITSFLDPVSFLAINDVKEYLYSGDYPNLTAAVGLTPDSEHVIKMLRDDALRFVPDWSVRYHCIAWLSGDMTCLAYDKLTHQIWIQQTRKFAGVWRQIQWLCDPVTRWNLSWPGAPYDDLGPYDAAAWVTPYKDINTTVWTGSYVEFTNGAYEVIDCIAMPLHDPVTGEYIAVESTGLLLGVFTDFLTGYVSDTWRAVIVDKDNNLMGSSVEGMELTGMGPDGYQVPLAFTAVTDPVLNSIAYQYTPGETVRSMKVSLGDGTTQTMKVLSRAITSARFGATIITAIPEKEFTQPLINEAQTGMIVGIVIMVVWPIVFSLVAVCLSLLIIYSTSKLKDIHVGSDGLATGMDFAIGTLQSLQKANSRNKAIVAALDQVLGVLCSGSASKLFRPDIEVAAREGKLQEDQLVYLRGELAMTKTNETGAAGNRKNRDQMIAMTNLDASEELGSEEVNSADALSFGVVTNHHEDGTIAEEDEPIPNLNCWSFSVLTVSSDHPLVTVAMQCLTEQGLINQFKLKKSVLKSFLMSVEQLYHPENPYHNALHAADMVQAIHSMICGQIEPGVPFNMAIRFTPLERLTMLLSGAVHDVGHTGQNNNFHVATESSFALAFNDQAVLENHHLVTGWKLIKEFGLLKMFDAESLKEVRRLMIALVLSTDMSQHFQILSEFKAAIQSGAGFEKSTSTDLDGRGELKAETKLLVMRMMFKMADTSNATRPSGAMQEWAKRVFDEFLIQGDLEKKLKLPVTPHMDRNTSRLPRLQNNFLQFVAIPMWKAFNDFHPIPQIIRTLESNQAFWATEDAKLSKSLSTLTASGADGGHPSSRAGQVSSRNTNNNNNNYVPPGTASSLSSRGGVGSARHQPSPAQEPAAATPFAKGAGWMNDTPSNDSQV